MTSKVAIVTGGGEGIGRAIVKRFAQEGAQVVIAEIEPTGQQVAQQLNEQGLKALFLQTDVAKAKDRNNLVRTTLDHFGHIDILVNNAGIYFPRSVFEMTQADWTKMMSVNLDAVFFLSQLAAQAMKEQGGGRIINVASVNSWLGMPLSSHYNAAKGGVAQITRCLAVELAPYNILVNAVAPGFIKTRMAIVDGVDETETEFFKTFYCDHRRIPLGRAGLPEEVASAVYFLASDDCQYITGHLLVVDGGLSITF
ncbi:MAG: SDR family oxidoreductase [Armatimonadota bacterium]|nr:SDR family oxidoreductase [Armatimonadota bacterium]